MGIKFDELKSSLSTKNRRLYDHGNEISIEPGISDLVFAINNRPEACTESSCQGHFGTFIEGKRIVLNFDGEILRADNNGLPFQELYHDIDLGNVEFFYDRGAIGLAINESDAGKRLARSLEEWTEARRDRVFLGRNEYSALDDGKLITFSPDHSQWVSEKGGYPLLKVRTYCYGEILQLNAGRLLSITELRGLFGTEI